MIYSMTMLPATNDPAEISKCFLDLLKKLNDVSSSIPTISTNGPSIYASGSNSNGSYIQFADGTMIEWFQSGVPIYTGTPLGSLLYYNGSAQQYTFPISFIGASPIVCPMGAGYYLAYATHEGQSTLSLCNLEICSVSASGLLYPGYIAIGRWK